MDSNLIRNARESVEQAEKSVRMLAKAYAEEMTDRGLIRISIKGKTVNADDYVARLNAIASILNGMATEF